jgi:plastocyanin
VTKPIRVTLAALALAVAGADPAGAQSLLDRSPNLTGGWVGYRGQLYFNFMHRVIASDAPARKVSNTPTFTFAAGLPARTLVGFHYATNSSLAPGYPNEWEFWARHQPISQEAGAPFDLTAQAGYNLAADGVDGEVTLSRRIGALRLSASGRALSNPYDAGDSPEWAVAGGGTLRLNRFIALAGDAATLIDREHGEKVAWSGGLHLAIPNTPHTLSLQASNTSATTLQAVSRGEEEVRYGFEFTIPLTLSRWLRSRGGEAAPVPVAPAAPPEAQPETPTGPMVRASIRNMAFAPARLEVAAGTTVEWTNNDPLPHSVTSTSGAFDSGLIASGRTFRRTFSTPGTYEYQCTPHPFMKGTVTVR